MFLIIILSSSLILIFLFLRDLKEGRKFERNIECGWRITPYINSRIGSFENRMDLEKMRISQLIKNTLPLEKDIIFIENTSDRFYLKNGEELLAVEMVSTNEPENYVNGFLDKKVEVNNTYDTLLNLLKKFLWSLKEESINSLERKIYLKFECGYIKLNISSVDRVLPLENFNNDLVKS